MNLQKENLENFMYFIKGKKPVIKYTYKGGTTLSFENGKGKINGSRIRFNLFYFQRKTVKRNLLKNAQSLIENTENLMLEENIVLNKGEALVWFKDKNETQVIRKLTENGEWAIVQI